MTTASDFQRLNNAISTNLKKFNTNTSDLESLVKKLGTPEDSEQLRDRYFRLQNETKTLIQQINNDLKLLQNTSAGNEVDQRKKKTLIETLPKQYLATLNRFQEAQRLGIKKEKESLERAQAVSYHQQNTNDSQFDNNFASSSTGYQQQQVVLPMEQEVDMKSLRERGEQLRQLETNIVELNDIYKDMYRVVHEHGEIIESVSNHIAETEQHVTTGTKKLVQAVTYQSAARRKKFICIGILLVVLAIIALALGLYFGLGK